VRTGLLVFRVDPPAPWRQLMCPIPLGDEGNSSTLHRLFNTHVVNNVVRALELKRRARLAVPAQGGHCSAALPRRAALQNGVSTFPPMAMWAALHHSRDNDFCQSSAIHDRAHAALVAELQQARRQQAWNNSGIQSAILPCNARRKFFEKGECIFF